MKLLWSDMYRCQAFPHSSHHRLNEVLHRPMLGASKQNTGKREEHCQPKLQRLRMVG